jgi:GxxExxY protein
MGMMMRCCKQLSPLVFQEVLVALVDHANNIINLGPGLLESSYQSCLCRELELRGIRHQSQVELPLRYKGIKLANAYVIDFFIEDSLIVEMKSVEKLLPVHSSQLMTYMRLRGVSSGLLINFNVATLIHGIRRVLF